MNKIIILLLIFLSLDSRIYISNEEIRGIYQKYVLVNLNNEYRNRYKQLPLDKNESIWPWENKDFPRVISMLEFERFIKDNKIVCQNGLAFNGVDPEWHYLKDCQITRVDYIDNPEKFDLHKLELEKNDYDFVMCNQTLEHVYDPIKCLENIYKHMKEGGILYFNVPGDSIPHDTPIHFYTGFTPIGVAVIVKSAGFKILNIGHWGNLEYIQKSQKESNWPDYREIKSQGLNDTDISPAIVWVFAQK